MKKLYSIIAILFFAVSVMHGQSTLTINVADSGTSLPIEGASVQSSSFSGQTDASGQLVVNNIADGIYNYTVTADCYLNESNSVTVAGSDVGSDTDLDPETTNNVFFFVGSPFVLSGATVNLTGPNGYNESIVTGAILGDLFENVPYGDYNYTISLDCYETLSGSVTVECIGGGQGVSVFATPQEETTNNVFFFVGSPFVLSGATVNLTGPNGYNESIVTGAILGDLFENVPYGDYNYTISLDCYETLSGSVTVECIGGGQGVSVFATPQEETTNNVFFFVGSPFVLSGATVNLTGPNGYNESIVTGAILGDLFENVPYGDYNYTISLDCYETLSGSVTVECIGGGQGVSVFATPQEETTNNVFFFVGSPFTLAGATVNLTGPNGYNESIVTGAILGDLFENVPYGDYNYTISLDCYETLSGSVTVECIGGGQGVSVFATPQEETTNNVFFFVGSPFVLSGATVNLTGPNGYNESIVTGAILGDLFENVPYGDYNYTISLDCYETLSGSVTVECIGGGQGVSVFATPQEETTNNVFFFVGSPFTLAGATVNLTGPNGYNESIVTGAILGDLFENVPYGDYNYTITLDCYETLTGSVTVECIGGGQGVSVFVNPVEIVLDTEVTLEEGNILISSATGVTYQWIDCATEEPIEGATNQFFVATEEGEYAVILTQNNCSATSECIPTSTPCESPYPAVNPESLNATMLPNGNLRFEWEPISGQIGCQINILVGAGPQQASVVRLGSTANQFVAPVSQLVPFTTYNYRVRCGCSQNPLIAGQFTPYVSVFYLPPAITEEMGDAYADTPLSQIDGDTQWNSANLGENVVSELFAMASTDSWVRVAPNPAQDNVNLSYNTAEEGQGLIRVYDAQGKLALERVMTFNEGLNNVNLNLNELEKGMYIVEVLKGDSRKSVRLLMQ